MAEELCVDVVLLAEDDESGTAVEILQIGTFADRNGQEVEIDGEDLDAFVANFEAGTAGQEVPIDIEHERGKAAGWIRELQRVGDKLVAVPVWNDLGRELVGGRLYRYLSATIDLAKKIIKSVSLVNFPAVKGLAPVELSEGMRRQFIRIYRDSYGDGPIVDEHQLQCYRDCFGCDPPDALLGEPEKVGGGQSLSKLVDELMAKGMTSAELEQIYREETRAAYREVSRREAELRAASAGAKTRKPDALSVRDASDRVRKAAKDEAYAGLYGLLAQSEKTGDQVLEDAVWRICDELDARDGGVLAWRETVAMMAEMGEEMVAQVVEGRRL